MEAPVFNNEEEKKNSSNTKESKTRWWLDLIIKHPSIPVIKYTIFIASAVFAYSKFFLIENTQLDYIAQLETKNAVISQLEMRIKFLETENSRLESDLNRYEEWLRSTPGTLEYLQAENETLQQQVATGTPNNTETLFPHSSYSKTYDAIEENNSIVDEKTGIVVSIKNIDIHYEGTLSIWAPGNELEIIDKVSAGFTKEIMVDSTRYQLSVTMLDFTSDSYSIFIHQLEE